MSKTVTTALDTDCCSGCGICASLAPDSITMEETAAGYLRPVIVNQINPTVEKTIANACPSISLNLDYDGSNSDSIWGPIHSCGIGYATDRDVRKNGSSGGVITAILQELLRSGKISSVLQVEADEISPIRNSVKISLTQGDVMKAAGSRYAPSSPLVKLLQEVGNRGKIALVGKPCDIAAARMLAKENPVLANGIYCFVSFFCAGVPSIKGANEILQRLGIAEKDVRSFRYRGNGWPGQATAITLDQKSLSMSYEDSWGNVLSKHLQFRCKICPDSCGSFADIVCADAWECDENGYPLFEEREGQSLILTRTAKGTEILEQAKSSKSIEYSTTDVRNIDKMQPAQLKRKSLIAARIAAFNLLNWSSPIRFRGLSILQASRQARLDIKLSNFLGTLRRVFQQKMRKNSYK
jgi:coenzyme F420 hydrogenase subunit beta